MFGWFKKRAEQLREARRDVAAAAASEAHSAFVRVEGAIGGVHADMSRDPFLVGAVSNHAAIMSVVVAGGRCPLAVTEAAMILAIQLAFGRVGVGRAEAVGLLLEFKNHPEYTKGAQVSTLILAARYGRKDLQGDPLLMEAKARVRSMPKGLREAFGSEEDEQVAEVLFQDLLVGPIKDRYGELWRTR